MKILQKSKKVIVPVFITALVCFYLEPSRSSITLVTVTPAAPTILSNGLGYYLAGETYTFSVRVTDPTATQWSDITQVRLRINNAPDIDMNIGPLSDITVPTVTAPAVTVTAGTVNAVCQVFAAGDTWNDFTARFDVTFRWDTPHTVWAAGRLIRADASSNSPPIPSTDFATANISYGVCSQIRMFNQSQDGVAADGWVNRWHSGFNVSGVIVYDVPGATLADNVEDLTGEITNTWLILDGATVVAADGAMDGGTKLYEFAVPASTVNVPQAAAHLWTVRAAMTTPVGNVNTQNNLSLRCDEVVVTSVQFIGGGGVTVTPSPNAVYYRSRSVAGVQLRVAARMRFGGATVIGNTSIRIRDITDGINYDITIPNGQSTWDLPLVAPYNTTPAGNDSTIAHTYQSIMIWGGVTDAEQTVPPNVIYQPGNGDGVLVPLASSYTVVNWETMDPPGTGSPFTNGNPVTVTPTATSMAFSWTPLVTTSPQAGGWGLDGDFDSYRIYYKLTTSGTFTMIDRTTAGYAVQLGTITSNASAVFGLLPVNSYDWKFSAVDVWGNEVAYPVPANQAFGTVNTAASQTDITLSDGISKYENASFDSQATTNPNVTHKVRKVNLRVIAKVITGGNNPDAVSIVLANNAIDLTGAPQWGGWPGPGGIGTQDDITTLALTPGTKEEYNCLKTGANTWEGYIPGDSTLMAVGNTLRFVLKITYKGVDTYEDHVEDPPGLGDWWSREWRFSVEKTINTLPWPTKILNNVLTKSSPTCYPAYYLTEDANVTIKIYDVLGRPIATLLDGAFRKGGENIKDQGWSGITKAGKKVGPGLYYIHIKAESLSGNTILNKFNKVAVAW